MLKNCASFWRTDFFSAGQMKFLCVIYAHMCVNGNTGSTFTHHCYAQPNELRMVYCFWPVRQSFFSADILWNSSTEFVKRWEESFGQISTCILYNCCQTCCNYEFKGRRNSFGMFLTVNVEMLHTCHNYYLIITNIQLWFYFQLLMGYVSLLTHSFIVHP